jgi:hypothetical protein
MNLRDMNPRDRRAIVYGLAILLPSLGWLWGYRPIAAAIAETSDRITMERDALSREQAAVLEATRNPVRKKIADSAVAAAASKLFTGANDVAAGASLVTYLGEVAKKTHVWLATASTRQAPASGLSGATGLSGALTAGAGGRGAARPASDAVRQLRVELRAETDFQGVLQFLDALERGDKLVTVERLDVAKALRAGDEDRETLAVTATVVGYAMPLPAVMPAPGAKPAQPAATGGKAP